MKTKCKNTTRESVWPRGRGREATKAQHNRRNAQEIQNHIQTGFVKVRIIISLIRDSYQKDFKGANQTHSIFLISVASSHQMEG
mmetsp:Transcript_37843/g.52485  ORF Transcript_37843/g.52485 Transcript_37843/m.52485 type:complete len:84 (-) Transcript_37843:1486-1737(-)